jgi:general secretion pathway protein G
MYWDKGRLLRRGFSFIEVMIVVVIIGLLAGAVTLSTRHFMDKAKQNRARADLST